MTIGEKPNMNKQPTIEEINVAVGVLRKLDPGFLPKEIFLEFARLGIMPIIEVVPLRKNQDTTEVLLLRRPADDLTWPNKLHTPGTVLRATDVTNGIDGAIQRIYDDELGFNPNVDPVFTQQLFHNVSRGAELSNIYTVDLTGIDVIQGEWFNASALPDDIIDTQIGFIDDSVKLFNERRIQ